jgi:hypothetical protein
MQLVGTFKLDVDTGLPAALAGPSPVRPSPKAVAAARNLQPVSLHVAAVKLGFQSRNGTLQQAQPVVAAKLAETGTFEEF